MMNAIPPPATIGLLLSGGLDSAIMLGGLLARGERVQPFYIRAGLHWEPFELDAVNKLRAALANERLLPLVVLDLPLGDLYGDHWSITGRNVPSAASPDEAVFLPGRNALLVLKAAVYCQLHSIGRLALAPLGSSPFGDARPEFFRELEQVLNRGASRPVRIEPLFANMKKQQVMELGGRLPLELTFSCIAPVDALHCGRCNKCAERQAAFAQVGRKDLTRYAAVQND